MPPSFAANLTMLFNEVGFVHRFAAAARAGFTGVEYLFPYEYEPAQLRQALHDHRLTQVLHNLPAGNWSAGERGIACHPDRTAEFEDGVEQAIRYANALECTPGQLPRGHRSGQRRSERGALDVRRQPAICRAALCKPPASSC